MDLGLKDKVVLITGGTRGIGRAIAEAFFTEGARVAVAARGDDGLRAVEAALPGAKGFSFDAFAADSRAELVEAVVRHFGRLDVLVNNAGASYGADAATTPLEDYRRAMEINFFAAVDLALRALPHLEAVGGTVVNVSSIWGREAGGKAPYNAAKAALISFTKALGDAAIRRGVRVVGVAPGSIRHPGGSWDRRVQEDPEGMRAFVAANIPAGRFGTAEEVAAAVVFLASPRASWIVGTTVVVDGGQSKMF
ncbi:MAG: SDR family oxidoreductase [Hydrogenibacillus schlegelii]|uniref:3-oxoacyl-[acyl-carrier protein] reductase n=1 Tax=Hydrogenibacillus schlegelii TaxID=1484 RepID=A0A2T5GFN9_HYDSH|nr:SDR family oxidoreductase [Hydrogenibacillus schlegelii]MBT9281396.1 SDR family oxidoreductase [Hydrogenibacillus schlegelii]PTQ55006.1 MAG: 3-oxoacyl-[acyl-carrier protein] reductase [Hydrogenibacillus schlegelii]